MTVQSMTPSLSRLHTLLAGWLSIDVSLSVLSLLFVKTNTVKLHYNSLLEIIRKRPLCPKSVVSKHSYIQMAHEIQVHG